MSLKKIVGSSARNMRFSSSWCRVELNECILHLFVKLHDCSLISASITIVGSTKNRHDVSFMAPVVALHDKLMSSSDKSKSVVVVELIRNILAEGISSASRRKTPSRSIIGIRPEKITHGAFVGNFLNSIKSSDVIKSIDGGRKSTVQTENLIFDQGSQRKIVEQVSKHLPDIRSAIFSKALVIETINLSNLSTFVISSQNSDSIFVSAFEGNQKRHSLDRIVPTINIITHEKIIGVRAFASNSKEFDEIVELSVKISANGDGASNGLDIGFVD